MANDWAYDLEESNGLAYIEETLDHVHAMDAEDYLEAPDAEVAIAACDTLARLKGHFQLRNSYTKKVDEWVATQKLAVPADLAAKAIETLDRILTEPSELLDLWEESGDADEWKQHLEDLKAALK